MAWDERSLVNVPVSCGCRLLHGRLARSKLVATKSGSARPVSYVVDALPHGQAVTAAEASAYSFASSLPSESARIQMRCGCC